MCEIYFSLMWEIYFSLMCEIYFSLMWEIYFSLMWEIYFSLMWGIYFILYRTSVYSTVKNSGVQYRKAHPKLSIRCVLQGSAVHLSE